MARSSRFSFSSTVIAIFFATLSFTAAQVIVNPPQPLTHRVQVQPIRVGNTAGAFATTFGPANSEAYIKDEVNRIWAQLGVRIDWLPMVDHIDNFTFNGAPGNYTTATRPRDHLNAIVNALPSPPKSPSAIVLNLFFVSIVPGFSQTHDNAANGLAFIDSNGITMHVGANLPGFRAGRDVIASVLAHEIGHNLGLDHSPAGSDNLMSSGSGTSHRLTEGQRNIIFADHPGAIDGFDFLQPLPPHPNYALWAENHRLTGGPAADDDQDGIPNLIEFMLGLDPNAFSVLPSAAFSPSGLTWTLRKRQAALDDGFDYRIEVSSDLVSWSEAGADESSIVLVDDATTLSVRLGSGNERRFMRLNVPIPPTLLASAIPVPGVLDQDPAPRVLPSCDCGVEHHH